MGGRGTSSKTSVASTAAAPGLDRALVQRANGASALGMAGDEIDRRFQLYAAEIGTLNLRDDQRAKAYDDVRRLATEALEATAENPNPFATGRARTNVSRNQEGTKTVARANGALDRLMEGLRDASDANTKEDRAQRWVQATKGAFERGDLEVVFEGKRYTRKTSRSKYFDFAGYV